MKPIYEPTGKAKEYGDFAINIYTGCPHRCYYCFVDQNGNAFSRDCFDGENWIDNPEFDEQVSKAKENSSGCYICVVDLHD